MGTRSKGAFKGTGRSAELRQCVSQPDNHSFRRPPRNLLIGTTRRSRLTANSLAARSNGREMSEPKTYTVRQAAAKIGCHPSTVSRHLPDGIAADRTKKRLTGQQVAAIGRQIHDGPGSPLCQNQKWQRAKGRRLSRKCRDKDNCNRI